VDGSTTTSQSGLLGCPTPLATTYDLAVLDLDGVLYIGPDAVPGAPEALAVAREAGLRTCFVTNNASRTASTVAEHLTRLGIPARTDEVVTSAQVASAILARRLPPGAAVLVVGGEGLRAALTEQGLRPVRSVDEQPQAVVQGFDPDLSWRDLAEGTRAVRSGLVWTATNLDLTVPTPYGPAPGNGALVGLVAAAAGRQPDEVAGKPRPGSFVEASRRYGSSRPLVVGDRLDTDLEGARAAGQDGLLVLTGVSVASDVIDCPAHRRPTYLGRDLTALTQPHPEVGLVPVTAGAGIGGGSGNGAGPGPGMRARAGAARVLARAGALEVEEAGPDALDLLRAAAQAAWAWTDRAARETASSDGVAPGPVAVAPGTSVLDPGAVLDALRRLEPGAAWAR
jgi:glycerol 3-phosphatase-2